MAFGKGTRLSHTDHAAKTRGNRNTQDFRETGSVSLQQRQHFPHKRTSDENICQSEDRRDEVFQDESDVNRSVNIDPKGDRYSRR